MSEQTVEKQNELPPYAQPGELAVLFDGNSLVHRAFHAMNSTLMTTQGEIVNAVFGFSTMLMKALNELKPDYVAVAFDKSAPTFRHVEYTDYKAQRPKMDDTLRPQFGRVRQLLEAFGIPIYGVEGWEADDVLGTLARQAAEQGVNVMIVTGDNDALQLVGPRIHVMTNRKGMSDTVVYDEAAVVEKYGIPPSSLTDFKGLKKDASDNIPGVAGIGEKTASKLIAEWGTIENLYANLDKLPNRTRELLEKGAEDARLSKRLATIQTGVPDVQFARDRMQFSDNYDRQRVVDLFRELEFRSLLGRLPKPGNETPAAPVQPGRPLQLGLFGDPVEASDGATEAVAETAANYRTIDTEEALEDLAKQLEQSFGFAFDTETTGNDSLNTQLVGLSFALEEGKAVYIPVGHVGPDVKQLPLERVLQRLKPVLENAAVAKYAHNGKFDMNVLSQYNVCVYGLSFDTMVAAYLLESTQRTRSLKDLALALLGVEMTEIAELIGRGKTQITMAQVPVAQASAYAGADADMTLRLVHILTPQLHEAQLWDLFTQVEMPLVPVLALMEQRGVLIDVPFLHQLSRDLHEKIQELEKEIYALAGHEFSIGSPAQLGKILFEELKLPVIKRTKTSYSTDAESLNAILEAHPVVRLILEWRQLTKLKSTYVDALPAMINPRDGRLHTDFNQTGTTSGRLSSSNPNLQNIPIRSEIGRQIRRAFIADQGKVLLTADYSQIELRILAHMAGDPALVDAYRKNEDVHIKTAMILFDVPAEKVTKDMRRIGKTVNFAVIYGQTDYGLAQDMGISRAEAGRYIEEYNRTYAGVREFLDNVKRDANERGYVTTILGRRRYMPELKAQNRHVRAEAERAAMNMPIQGSNADIIKIAMVNLQKQIEQRGLQSRLILQVHDELVLEVPENEVETMRVLVPEMMINAYPLAVPVEVEVHVGPNWYDLD